MEHDFRSVTPQFTDDNTDLSRVQDKRNYLLTLHHLPSWHEARRPFLFLNIDVKETSLAFLWFVIERFTV